MNPRGPEADAAAPKPVRRSAPTRTNAARAGIPVRRANESALPACVRDTR